MKKFLAGLLAITLLFSTVGSSTLVYANENEEQTNQEAVDSLKVEIEQELKFLFEEATTYEDGELIVNKQLLIDKYGKEQAPYIAAGIKRIYEEDDLANNLKAELENKSFWSCMGNELIGMIPGMELIDLMSGNLKGYIEGKMWGKAAEYIAEKLVKFGLKSNVAGIAAQLAISSGKCLIWG